MLSIYQAEINMYIIKMYTQTYIQTYLSIYTYNYTDVSIHTDTHMDIDTQRHKHPCGHSLEACFILDPRQ